MPEKIKLTPQRRGEIALAIMVVDIRLKQITLSKSDLKRKMGTAASQLKADGIAKEELIAMYEEIIIKAVEEMFDKKLLTAKLQPPSEERKGEIALTILKREVKSRPIILNKDDLNRKIGSGYSQLEGTGITKEEFIAMYEEIIMEVIAEMFAKETAGV